MLVVVNISPYYFGGNFIAHCSDKISITPEFTTSKVSFQPWKLSKHCSGAYSFENIYNLCWRVSWKSREKDMDMIRDNFHGIYLKFIVLRYLKKNLFELISIGFREYLFPILWYSYQMVLCIIDRMRGSLDWCHALHYFST